MKTAIKISAVLTLVCAILLSGCGSSRASSTIGGSQTQSALKGDANAELVLDFGDYKNQDGERIQFHANVVWQMDNGKEVTKDSQGKFCTDDGTVVGREYLVTSMEDLAGSYKLVVYESDCRVEVSSDWAFFTDYMNGDAEENLILAPAVLTSGRMAADDGLHMAACSKSTLYQNEDGVWCWGIGTIDHGLCLTYSEAAETSGTEAVDAQEDANAQEEADAPKDADTAPDQETSSEEDLSEEGNTSDAESAPENEETKAQKLDAYGNPIEDYEIPEGVWEDDEEPELKLSSETSGKAKPNADGLFVASPEHPIVVELFWDASLLAAPDQVSLTCEVTHKDGKKVEKRGSSYLTIYSVEGGEDSSLVHTMENIERPPKGRCWVAVYSADVDVNIDWNTGPFDNGNELANCRAVISQDGDIIEEKYVEDCKNRSYTGIWYFPVCGFKNGVYGEYQFVE